MYLNEISEEMQSIWLFFLSYSEGLSDNIRYEENHQVNSALSPEQNIWLL